MKGEKRERKSRSSKAKNLININAKKGKPTNGRTNERTDGPMDGPTERGVKSRSTRLKMEKYWLLLLLLTGEVTVEENKRNDKKIRKKPK